MVGALPVLPAFSHNLESENAEAFERGDFPIRKITRGGEWSESEMQSQPKTMENRDERQIKLK